MSTPPAAKRARPLSPHLQVYRPQLTSMLSILHRASGVGLALGLPVLVAWLVALAGNKPMFTKCSPAGSRIRSARFYCSAGAGRFSIISAPASGICSGMRGFFSTSRMCTAPAGSPLRVSTLFTGYVWLHIVLYDWNAGGMIAGEFIGAVIVLAIAGGHLSCGSCPSSAASRKKHLHAHAARRKCAGLVRPRKARRIGGCSA